MRTIYSDRRHDVQQFRHLNHAIELVRTHGWRYAVEFLRNQRIDESTLQRVLFGEWCRRRASANHLIIAQQLRARHH
ncbi:hypothetical protein SAMN05518865_10828 [Duganella sp. CF458]|uniref:hypothetical protein n=1 Tax=Duganella sp. CF458 TaxID=1884368 RepID=UPI0008E4AFAB|nr:hypothetical protein [Duganella sp. CF458]SFG07570.1 hypothetical protein SAMN05518865_10828 [Duganella sp. CF458]